MDVIFWGGKITVSISPSLKHFYTWDGLITEIRRRMYYFRLRDRRGDKMLYYHNFGRRNNCVNDVGGNIEDSIYSSDYI